MLVSSSPRPYEETVEENARGNDDDWTHDRKTHDGSPYCFVGTKERAWLRCLCGTKHEVNYFYAQRTSFVGCRWDSNGIASFQDCDGTKGDKYIEIISLSLRERINQ